MPRITTRAQVRSLAALVAVATASAVAAPAASADTEIYVKDGVSAGDGSHVGNYVSVYDSSTPTRVQIVRGGALVSDNASSWSEFDIQPGDVVRLLNRDTGTIITDAPYDGRPAIDAAVCAGATTFSGSRSSGATVVDVAAFTLQRVTGGRYGDYTRATDFVDGTITSQNGEAFGGTFARALPAGHILSATQARSLSATVNMVTTVERTVGACPVPAPPAAPAAPVKPVVTPPVVTPKQLVQQLLKGAVAELEDGGLKGAVKPQDVRVTVSTPGTVEIQMFRGSAPKKVTVYAAAKKKAAKKTKKVSLPANVIASGKRVFSKAGSGTVKVKPTKRAKRLVKGKKRLKVTVRTIFVPKGGKAVSQDLRITLKR